ncbi:MAG: hypothetical protein WD033_02370 [Nitrosopumilaceae archaeon]
MKKLAKIPSFLLSSELASSLKLQDQSYIMIIPKPILAETGVTGDNLDFDLVVKDGKLSLIGPSVPGNQRVMQSSEEIAT